MGMSFPESDHRLYDPEFDEPILTDAQESCYYHSPLCEGEVWQCKTCGENYCETHWHETSKGINIECVACESARINQE